MKEEIVIQSHMQSEEMIEEEVIEEEMIKEVEEEIIEKIEEKEIQDEEEKEKEEIEYKKILKELGYYQEDDSRKDINLRNAILRFQSDHNITADGFFGPESLSTMKKRIEDEEYQYTDVITSTTINNKWITINKTKRILTLYKGNQVVKKYPIAIGKTSTPTPSAKCHIINKMVNPYWGGMNGKYKPEIGGAPTNPLGRRWLGLSLSGGGYGIHGNASPYSIGTNVSYGCIRMINADVKELYDLVNEHTPVWIGSHEELKEWGVDNKSYLE